MQVHVCTDARGHHWCPASGALAVLKYSKQAQMAGQASYLSLPSPVLRTSVCHHTCYCLTRVLGIDLRSSGQAVVVYTFSPSTQEVEAERSLVGWRLAWSI